MCTQFLFIQQCQMHWIMNEKFCQRSKQTRLSRSLSIRDAVEIWYWYSSCRKWSINHWHTLDLYACGCIQGDRRIEMVLSRSDRIRTAITCAEVEHRFGLFQNKQKKTYANLLEFDTSQMAHWHNRKNGKQRWRVLDTTSFRLNIRILVC